MLTPLARTVHKRSLRPPPACSSAARSEEEALPGDGAIEADPLAAADGRVRRLEQLLCLRRFYRNCVRAEAYHRNTAPVYVPYTPAEIADMPGDDDRRDALETRRSEALDILADMVVIREQVQADVKALLPNVAMLFCDATAPSGEDGAGADGGEDLAARARVGKLAAGLENLALASCGKLRKREERELHGLGQAFQNDPPVRILRKEVQSRARQMSGALSLGSRTPASYLAGSNSRMSVQIARDLVKENGVAETLRVSRTYISGLWARLNGLRASAATERLPLGMATPLADAERIWEQIEALQQRIALYEKRLKEVSKDRETRVRRAPIELRALMAYEMQDMDREVLSVGRELALCTLDVQLDYLYIALEDEARQILDVEPGRAVTGAEPAAELARVVPRRGSTEELSVLLAQFTLLMRRQAALRDVFQRQQARPSLLMPAFDDEVRDLAAEIGEARLRLGIPDQDVFGGPGLLSLRSLQLQLREAATTVQEGIDFFSLGVRMLASDVVYSGQLFTRASLGNTLKPREVTALRRTVKDLFTFVPFIIILIIPMTPLGHVLVFGFIQRYFPDFFPSQFNNQRQDMVKRYEDLRKQLSVAQAVADHQEEQEQLQQAAAAIARLTPPSMPVIQDQAQELSKEARQAPTTTVPSAAQQLKELEKRVQEAGLEAMSFGSDSEDDDGLSRRAGKMR
eukprot:jgi/Ulvmu1/819/UM010_0193.1